MSRNAGAPNWLLHASEARFRLVLDNSRDCVYRLNIETGGYEYISPAAERIVGYTPDELTAQDAETALSMVHPADVPAFLAALARMEETGEAEAEYRQRTKAGEYRWISNRLFLTRDEAGRPLYREGTIRDITERKRVEDELLKARQRAEETAAALQDADTRKNEFLAMLSHELRNPLTPVRNSLYILDRAVPGSEQAVRAQAVIDRQIGQLSRLVDDLLDLTRITRNKIHLQRAPFDLAELLRRTADDYRTQFTTAGIELRVLMPTVSVWVNADAARVAQAVGNLLQNAAKFTGKPGHVTLVLDEERPSGGATWEPMAVIRVRDDGIGISADVLPSLFQPFTQAENTLDRSRGGLGLGLALVKGMAELHGGTVEVRSEGLGKGAEFILRLPIEHEAAAVAPVARKPAARAAKRVLVIEDNVDAANSLREVLDSPIARWRSRTPGPTG